MKTTIAVLALVLALTLGRLAAAAPIHEAVWDGDLGRAVQVLDQDPAQINSWDDIQGRTPLHVAVQRDHLELAQLLIERGADVNAAGAQSGAYSYSGIGVSPLHLAAGKGAVAMMRLLLDHGADVSARSVPMWVRAPGETVPDAEALAEIMNAVRIHGKTPLHFAAMKGQTAAAELLLERGAALDQGDEFGQTALHLAVYYARRDMAVWLLDKGASISAKSKDGWGVVHFAAAGANADLLTLLLDRGAPGDDTSCAPGGTCAKITPLHLAALRGDRAIAAALLARGANPDAPAAGGSTARDLAGQKGQTEIVALLSQAPVK